MSRVPHPADPFAMTANAAVYMPRGASERALLELQQCVIDHGAPVLLHGPAGLGKTLLLRVLASRLQGQRHAVYLPYAALSPEELCAWALGLLGMAPSSDPQGALLAVARRLQQVRTPLLLLVDEAGSIPGDSARQLAALVAGSAGALQVVLAACDDERLAQLREALGPQAREVRLDAPMNAIETALYVRSRLERAGAPESVRAAFDAATLERIHRASGGFPRMIHRIGSELLRRGPEAWGAMPLEEWAAENERPLDPAESLERDAARPSQGAARGGETGGAREVSEDSLFVFEPDPASEDLDDGWLDEFEDEAGARDRVFEEEFTPRAPRVAPKAPGAREVVWIALALGAIAVAIPLLRGDLLGASRVPRSTAALPPPGAGERETPAERPDAAPPGEAARQGIARQPDPGTPAGAPGPSGTGAAEARVAEGLPRVPVPAARPIAAPQAVPPAALDPSGELLSVRVESAQTARVEVDGIDVGRTPVQEIPLVPGDHVFRLRMADGRVIERVVRIDAEHRELFFE